MVIIIASLKLSSSRPLIGRDLSITIPHMCSSFFLSTGLIYYYFLTTDFLKSYLRDVNPTVLGKIERKLAALSSYAWIIPVLCLLFLVFPLIGIFFPKYHKEFAMTSFIGLGVTTFFFSLFRKASSVAFTFELSNHIKNIELANGNAGQLKFIVKKMTRLSNIGGTCGLLLAIVTLAFGCSDFLLHRATYFILCTFVQIPIISAFILYSLFKRESKKEQQPNKIDKFSAVFEKKESIKSSKGSRNLAKYLNIDILKVLGRKKVVAVVPIYAMVDNSSDTNVAAIPISAMMGSSSEMTFEEP